MFPDLAAAVCVVWDAPERFGPDEDAKIDPAEPSRVFEHFIRNADRMALDPRWLPVDLLIYVVDLHLKPPELEWATRYGARPNMTGAFFAVPYREGIPYVRGGDEVNEQAYLLPNILRRGGSVADAAYFAAEIARANGIPAVVCNATGADAGGVAWTGFLQFGGGRPTWDFSSARHRDHAGWPGEMQDPQTHEPRSEAELAASVAILATPSRDRLASAALFKSAELVDAKSRFGVYRRAIELSPGNRWPWYALADYAATQKLDDVSAAPITELINQHLVKRWPEFATWLRLRMLAERGSVQFDDGIRRAASAVADRPNLVAMVRLAQIDRLRDEKRHKEAEVKLLELLQGLSANSPPLVLACMARLDELMRRHEALPRLAAIYRDLLQALPRPSPSKHARTTPYYRLAQKHAALLDELKDPQAASMVRTKLENLVIP
jgi:hypothetical protein